MFLALFRFELRYWLKQPAVYLYYFTFLGLAAVSFAGAAGFFDPPDPDAAPGRILNSPYSINLYIQYLDQFFLFLLPAIVGAAMYNDFRYRIHLILYSYPLKKAGYLFGKFFSALAVVAGITLTAGLGIAVAEHLPGLSPQLIGPFNPAGYVQVYLVYTLPNMLLYGAMVFAAVARYRNIYAGFAVVLLLLLFQFMAENLFSGNGFWLALADPFGQNTAAYVTRYWTPAEQNIRLLPVSGVVLYNRLLWAAIALVVFMLAYRKFSFSESAGRQSAIRSARRRPDTRIDWTPLPLVAGVFTSTQRIKTVCLMAAFDFKLVVKSRMFWLIGLSAVAVVAVALARVANTGEMNLLPLTRIVLSTPAFFFTGIVILLTMLYAGMLVQRARTSGMFWLSDVTPASDWAFLLSKVLAILSVQAVLLLDFLLAGVLFQCYQGYYRLEAGLYFFHLIVLVFPVLMIWAFAAVFTHTLVSNVYAALFLLLLGWLSGSALPQAGLNTRLLLFNPTDPLPYSDMDGYGGQLAPWLLVRAYWLVLGLLLLSGAWLFWYRGVPLSFSERLDAARRRATRPFQAMAGGLLLIWAALGGYIFWEEQKTFAVTGRASGLAFKAFEEKYSRYAGLVQPRITGVNVAVDLYPEKNGFEVRGHYTLLNNSGKTIDTLLLKTGFDEITGIEINRAAEILEADAFVHFSVRRLRPGLLPGDSLTLYFTIKNKPNTFFERNSSVLQNGTFLRQDIFPRLGYFLGAGQKNPGDSSAVMQNYQSIDADLIDFEATVSTPHDQFGLAPGVLQNTWLAGGRRYTRYKADQKIKFAFAFNAGRFAVKKVRAGDVRLEVYHHPAHVENLDRLLAGSLAALRYNSRYFGPYRHSAVRIIEFPHTEGSFATAFANNLPISELRFIASVDTAGDKVDLPFYTPAHELTHHWWGNQLLPADTRGALMLTESITEYITLKIYERQYGAKRAGKFLALQRERYLRGRTAETGPEPPLALVEPEQQYLAYGKGALAFNALCHYLGEDTLNHILRDFLDAYRDQGPPYPTSLDLVHRLRQSMPDALRYLVADWFETVSFYDNTLNRVSATPLETGQFSVELSFFISKNTEGQPLAPVKDECLEIGFYDQNGTLRSWKTVNIQDGENRERLVLDWRPSRAMLDPHLLTLEKDRTDNSRAVE